MARTRPREGEKLDKQVRVNHYWANDSNELARSGERPRSGLQSSREGKSGEGISVRNTQVPGFGIGWALR